METRQFRRSRTNRMIAGVCGGLGERFGIPPILVRIGFVLLGIPSGTGVLFYFILWAVTPEE